MMKFLVMLLLMGGLSVSALSFSSQGHQLICQMAFDQLTPPEQTQLLEQIKPMGWQSYAIACMWPDSQEKQAIKRKKLGAHYINLQRGTLRLASQDCGQNEACLFTAINKERQAIKQLKSKKAAQQLAYLGHWLGDIHQPMHVSFADDYGGNRMAVKDATECARNFHNLWDWCLLDFVWQQQRELQEATIKQKSAWLLSKFANESVEQGDVLLWANQSYEITQSKEMGYCQAAGCLQTSKKIAIDIEYYQSQSEVVLVQIHAASSRLAGLLRQMMNEMN